MSTPFDDFFGGSDPMEALRRAQASRKPAPKPEKGVQIHGRKVDGAYYVRAADVAALLEANGVLPGIAAKLRRADA